ncbi:myeloid differentiation primary response protein MyD88 [Agrilus planipennis]|uniref:Myeloid differentiation primary response protein MyD88 n=1 Tax=Agrilus planipennis TaxID=224129 RepID=A0A1W4W2K7_AGRPL|nr:myeloid differentiation primary response protein MyD88 [Agrilus planipennis]
MSSEALDLNHIGNNETTASGTNHSVSYDITIQALRYEVRSKISALLNPYKVIPTDDGLPRDWQGFAELIGITGEQLPQLEAEKDPTNKLLNLWQNKEKDKCTINRLLQFFEKLDRFDIIDDIQTLIEADIQLFQQNKNELQLCNSSPEADRLILTVDDVDRVNQGLKPQHYDAFVLYADEDIDFATKLLEMMEKLYNLKLCVKDRDLVGGAFEHDVIIKLISERCNRLVVIITAAFLKSSANVFFVSLAQAISIEQRQRKIIPCLYGPCKVPPEISCYVMLDYERSGKWKWNFWEKLRDSIQTPKKIPVQAQRNQRTFNRFLSDQECNRQSKFSTDNHLRSSLHDRKLDPPRNMVKFRSMVDLKSEDEESIKPDPALNVCSSSSNLSAMNNPNSEILKSNKTKTSWFKKFLPNKGEKKAEKGDKKVQKNGEKNEQQMSEKVKQGKRSKNKMGNNVIERVHHKSKKHFWTIPMKRKVAVLN